MFSHGHDHQLPNLTDSEAKGRVLLVHDSAVARAVLRRALMGVPEVAETLLASDEESGWRCFAAQRPDLLVVELADWLAQFRRLLKRVRSEDPTVPILALGTEPECGGPDPIYLFLHGVTDYLRRPKSFELEQLHGFVSELFIPRVRHLLAMRVARNGRFLKHEDLVQLLEPRLPVRAIVVGSSTGGPAALNQLLASLPPDMQTPLLIVQHMPGGFTRLLAERLASCCPLPVREAVHRAPLRPGEVWVARGGYHLELAAVLGQVELRLTVKSPENGCRPAADPLFRSACAAFGRHVIAVLLTGMGSDGLDGARQLREAGALIVAQDQDSSVAWGMPGAVVRARLAHLVAPLPTIAELFCVLARIQNQAHPKVTPAGSATGMTQASQTPPSSLRGLLGSTPLHGSQPPSSVGRERSNPQVDHGS